MEFPGVIKKVLVFGHGTSVGCSTIFPRLSGKASFCLEFLRIEWQTKDRWQLTLSQWTANCLFSLKPPPSSLLTAYQNFFSKSNFRPSRTAYLWPTLPPSNPQNLKLPTEIVSQDLSVLHKLFYQNKVINFIESTQSLLSFLFLAQENYNHFSKYTITLASCCAIHYNGSLDLLFLLLKLCSLQKIIHIFFYVLSKNIFTQFWSSLDKRNKDSCNLKEAFAFFLKFIQKLTHSVVSFSL